MNLRKSNLSLITAFLMLGGLSLSSCSDDEPKLTPEEIAGAVTVTASPDGTGNLVGGGLKYGITSNKDKKCAVLGFTEDKNYPTDLVIPGKLLFENKVYTVEEVDERSFMGKEDLVSVTIPEGVEEIEYASFARCTSLQKVVLPKSLKEIDDDVFYECNQLKEINLPEGLEDIGSEAFTSCYSLGELTLPSTLKEIGEYAFTNTYLTKLVCLAKNPPKFDYMDANYHYPDFLRIDKTPIYVPGESLQKYLNSEWGKTYPEQIFPL